MRLSSKALVWPVLAVLGLGTAACVPRVKAPNTIRFRYWGDGEEVKIIEGMLRDFENANPGVRVVSERKSPDATYCDQFLQEVAGGDAPDVVFISTDNFDILSGQGLLEDLTPWLAGEKSFKKSDYYPALVRRFSKRKKLLVLPRDIAPVACIYYNKDLFKAAGLPFPKDSWTWDDLRRDARKLTARSKDGTFKRIGFAEDWMVADAWILSGGGRQVDDYFHPHRFTFANPEALSGLLFRYRLQQSDGVMPDAADTQALSNGTSALFAQGRVAMFHSGLWKVPGFRHIHAFEWDVAPFPHKKGVPRRYYCAGSGYGIRAGVADPGLCWELVKFMAGPVGERKLAATGLTQPAIRSLAKSAVFLDGKEPGNKRMLLFCAEHSLSSPAWAPWQEFQRTVWGPKVDAVWIKGFKGNPARQIREAQKEANAKYFPRKP